MAIQNYTKSSTPNYAIDTIYVCLSCKKREKELALKDRIQKICSNCGGQSIKSTLVDSLSFVSGEFTPEYMKEYKTEE